MPPITENEELMNSAQEVASKAGQGKTLLEHKKELAAQRATLEKDIAEKQVKLQQVKTEEINVSKKLKEEQANSAKMAAQEQKRQKEEAAMKAKLEKLTANWQTTSDKLLKAFDAAVVAYRKNPSSKTKAAVQKALKALIDNLTKNLKVKASWENSKSWRSVLSSKSRIEFKRRYFEAKIPHIKKNVEDAQAIYDNLDNR